MKRLDKEILDNHKTYLERLEFYRGFGYDLEKEREFILNSAMPLSGRILEIGTGKGHFAVVLARAGLSFVTVDISTEEQDIARLNLQYFGLEDKVDFKIADARKLDFPDGSFGAVISVNVFHHLENPYAVLDEAVRVLSRSGKIVLSDFNQNGLEVINSCHSSEGRHHDHFKHEIAEAKSYFLNRGFSISEAQSQCQNVIIAHRN